MNDKELRQYVIDELDFEPSVDAARIGVSASDGIVTLSGHVGSYAQKLAAEEATWRVKGVKGVAQEIDVRFEDEKKHADDEIAHRAVQILAWDSMLPHGVIHVRVQDGWVTLTGELDWNYQRDIAVNDVRRLGGVKGVVNNITLKPRASAADVHSHITDALKRHAAVEADHVTVSVRDGGAVHLEGEVDTWEERRAAVDAAWATPGVQSVVNRLQIG